MSKKNNGGSAFPYERGLMSGQPQTGMSLRDYAAIKAMASLITVAGNQHNNIFGSLILGSGGGDRRTPSDRVANFAYLIADAMLIAREKES